MSGRALIAALCLASCASTTGVQSIPVDAWNAWLFIPDDLPDEPVPAVFHLHHSGRGEELANRESLQDALIEAQMIGVFPEGGGGHGDDWVVGRNKDEIQRDDRAFLADVADQIWDRDDVRSLWLGGFSKGGAMTYDMACLGEDVFDGFLPMAGAMEDWIFEDCPALQRPLRHLQGSEDDRWPLRTEDAPDSSHKGILESMAALQDEPGCMDAAPEQDGDCMVWPECAQDTRLCTFEGGHWEPSGYMVGHRAWIDRVWP